MGIYKSSKSEHIRMAGIKIRDVWFMEILDIFCQGLTGNLMLHNILAQWQMNLNFPEGL
jgi:hypothetical protein